MIEPSFQASDVNLFSELPVKRSLSRWFVILIGIPLLLEIVVLIATGSLERFVWLLVTPARGLIAFWPISIPILIWLPIGFIRCLNSKEFQTLGLLWLAPQVVLPITLLFFGAVFANPSYYSSSSERLQTTIQFSLFASIVFFASVVIALFAIFQNRGRQSFVAPFSLLSILNTFFSGLTAALSISGEWY